MANSSRAPLSSLANRVYLFTRHFIRDNHYAPSGTEIMTGASISSHHQVTKALHECVQKKWLGRQTGIARAIWLLA